MAFSSLLTFFEMIGSGHGHLWEHAVEFSHSRVCPILGHNPFIGGWSQRHQFTSRHALSLEEVRYSLHVTMMTLRSGDSFRSDDVWLVVLFSWMFVVEMLILGHSPLVIDDDFVRWQFMPDTYFPEIILHWGFAHFEMMHSHWGIATLPILTLRFHFLFMIAAFDGS